MSLSLGQAGDAPNSGALLRELQVPESLKVVIMDRIDEGEGIRQLIPDLGWELVAPPPPNRIGHWSEDDALYAKRNGVERPARSLKGFRRMFSRFDKADVIFSRSFASLSSSKL